MTAPTFDQIMALVDDHVDAATELHVASDKPLDDDAMEPYERRYSSTRRKLKQALGCVYQHTLFEDEGLWDSRELGASPEHAVVAPKGSVENLKIIAREGK